MKVIRLLPAAGLLLLAGCGEHEILAPAPATPAASLTQERPAASAASPEARGQQQEQAPRCGYLGSDTYAC